MSESSYGARKALSVKSVFVFSIVLLFFSACGGGGGDGGASNDSGKSTGSISAPSFSCELSSRSDLGDKGLGCNDETDISYHESENALCRVDNINGVTVSTCMESGQTLSAQTCMRQESSVACPDVSFTCEVNSRSTPDNWILSCDDDTAVSMDISNSELCRIDLTNGAGFCLDDENALNRLSVVWTGYASNVVGIGESGTLNTPLWGPNGTVFRYSATPASVCSVDGESGSLSIASFGDCRVTLSASIGENRKTLEKTVYGRLSQGTSWSGYTENSIDFGTTPPTLIAPQYAPDGASYSYSSENTDICTVNARTGAVRGSTEAGDCVITMTSSADNYADRPISFTLTINPLDLPTLTWRDPYGSGPFDILTTVSAPSAGAVAGQGSLGVVLENYRSTTPTICLVDETTGVPTLLLNGNCTIEADASLPGYGSQTLSTTLTVAPATMSLSWDSPIRSLGRADSVQPNDPAGIPGAAVVSVDYSSVTPEICEVDFVTGEITGIANGDCRARLTVSFPGYQEGSVDIVIKIKKPQKTEWTGYTASDVDFGSATPPTPEPQTDALAEASFTYSSLNPEVCTVDSSGALTLVGAGDCRIRLISSTSSASEYGDKLFEHTVRVNPLDFPTLEWGTLYGNGPFNVEGTGYAPDARNLLNIPSGVNVTLNNFESQSPNICQVDDTGSLTFLRDGSCSLRTSASATGYRDQVVSGSVDAVPINMNLSWNGYDDSDNTITFGEAAPILELPSVTTVTDHTFSYASEDSSVCSVSRYGNLTILGDGACEITLTASAPGYNDATETSTQTINPIRMTGVAWSPYSPESVGVGHTREATDPSGIPEGASVSYSTESEVCTVDEASGAVTGQSVGPCEVTLTVSKLGHEAFTQSHTVNVGGTQGIAWEGYSASTMVFGETPPTLLDPTDVDGAMVTYLSLTGDVCSVDGSGSLTILDQGLCTISLKAIPNLDPSLADRIINFDLRISPIAMDDFAWSGYADDNTATFPNAPNLEEPTGQVAGTTLSYASQSENICTVNETTGRLTILDAGVCTVTITAAAPGHTSVSANSDITIDRASMSFSWRGYSASSAVFGGRPPTLRAPTGAPRGTNFRYSSAPLTVCVVDPESGALTLSGSGTCTITAAGSLLGHTDGSEIFDLTVAPRSMSNLTWAGYSERSINFGETITLVEPQGVPRGTTFNYVSSAGNICSVDPTTGVLRILDAGSCMITLTASAASYGNGTVNFMLTINPVDMDSLAWSGYNPPAVRIRGTVPVINSPTGVPNNVVFAYASSDENICTVDGLTGELTIGTVIGTCSITLTANAPGYNEKMITANVTVAAEMDILWAGYDKASVTFPDAPNFISPVGVPSDATAVYTSSDEDVCSVDSASGVLTLASHGSCTITLTVTRSGYDDVVKTFSLTVGGLDMDTLAWTGYPESMLIKGPFIYPNSFTGEPSGVTVTSTYSTTTPDICLVEKDGDLWGQNLGTCRVSATAHAPGYNDKTFPAVDVTVMRGGVIAGAHRSCALLTDGQVKCWGDGTNGALGQENSDTLGDGTDEMGDHLPSVNLGTSLMAKFMAMANNDSNANGHACVILDNGRVKCWGTGGSGELGQGSTNNIGDDVGEMGDNLAYTDLGIGRTAKILSLGPGFSCALLDNGTLKCWGKNSDGQLGQNDSSNRGDGAGEMGNSLTPINLGMGRTAKDIDSGINHVCALLDNNMVKCWGGNSNGQLGQGNTDNIGDGIGEMESLAAVDLGDDRTAKRVAAGQNYTCAVLDNNDLACWGSNVSNRLGIEDDSTNPNIGDAASEMGENLVETHLTDEDAIYVDLGVDSTCVIRKNNDLYCWGQNDSGQLGLENSDTKGSGTTGAADIVVDLGSSRMAKMVQLGTQHVCALLDDDTIKCWGRNQAGQLGQENTATIGDESGEMGDNLTAVNLVPDMLGLAWSGYSSNNITFGENAPLLNAPTGHPTGATFSYSTSPASVCTVVEGTGVLTIVGTGICRVSLTASASGYRTGVRTFDLTVGEAQMSNFAWSGYSGSNTATFPIAPILVAPTGAPGGVSVTYGYVSTTMNICTVSSIGALTLVRDGTCTIRLTVSAENYSDTIVDQNITINKGTMSGFAWNGYAGSNAATFPNAPALVAPTGEVSVSYACLFHGFLKCLFGK